MPESEYPDALPHGAVRGRGAGVNPGNRFVQGEHDTIRLHVLGEHLDQQIAEHPAGVQVRTTIIDDHTRSVINRVDSPDFHFHWTFNPYRGCEHGCAYCYARPTHENLGYSSGLDFETKIIVKRNAPELLRRALAKPSWQGEPIAMSGVTDAYQPLERSLRITRKCLEVIADCNQPIGIVTKNHLIVRDLDLLQSLAKHNAVRVAISITTLDPNLARRLEPRASTPHRRLHAIEQLTANSIPTMVMLAPVIPGLNDTEIPAILEAAANAGAIGAGSVMLRLPYQVKDIFTDWLRRHEPTRADRVLNAVRSMHGGVLYNSSYGHRGRGSGPIADQIHQTFNLFKKRHGLDQQAPALSSEHFQRPSLDGQLNLFQ